MFEVHGSGRQGLTAIAVAVLLLGGLASAHALTTPGCLANKSKEWGRLRKCQAQENGRALEGKPADPAKCQTELANKLARLTDRATAAAIACRYGVNGDGTATDYDTGLQWEQKTDDGSVHDKDNTYSWALENSLTRNGTVFTAFLGTLNDARSEDGSTTSGCFAGHCDWRLPAIEELAGIVDLGASGCPSGSPCIDQTVFGPTVALGYWSASSPGPPFVWRVDFNNGTVVLGMALLDRYVRGVRSGL